MTQTRSLQEWVHWLEVGGGARWIRRGALFLAMALLSVRICIVQFHGPLTEKTLAQTVVGRQLADGKGFTTLINFPQTAAWLRLRGHRFDAADAFPELHEPPLYSALIGAVFKLIPAKARQHLFATAPVPPDGLGADYVLLVLNVLLLWLAAWLAFLLGRKIFEATAGLIASFALMLSVSVWDQTVAVNGMPLMMVLLLGLFHTLASVDEQAGTEKTPWKALLGCGALSGLLFLGDYSTGFLVIFLLVYGWLRFFGSARGIALALIAAGFLIVTSPWILRNLRLTGNALAFAGQAVALKAGDSTAEPGTVRATLSTATPVLDLNKLGNKGLTSLQKTLRDRMWSGGGFFLTAFFVVGFLYRFREAHVNRLRWMSAMSLALLVAAQAFFDSGEGERLPIVYATPVLMVFGSGFFLVLVASSDSLARHARWVTAGLLFAQALPLIHDLAAPQRIHFNYPPYYPALFLTLRSEVRRVGGDGAVWMADVPAGAAWYSGQRVWAQPATLRDFYTINVEQPLRALVLTPHILDRPFFSDLARTRVGGDRFGEWGQVYTGLVTGRLPPAFPLSLPQRMAENFYVLIDPLMLPNAGK